VKSNLRKKWGKRKSEKQNVGSQKKIAEKCRINVCFLKKMEQNVRLLRESEKLSPI